MLGPLPRQNSTRRRGKATAILSSAERLQVSAGLSQAHSRRLLLHGCRRTAQFSGNLRGRTIGKQSLELSDIVSGPQSYCLYSGHNVAPFLALHGRDTRRSRSSARASSGHIYIFFLFYAPHEPNVLTPILSLPLSPDRPRRAGRGDAHFRVTSITPDRTRRPRRRGYAVRCCLPKMLWKSGGDGGTLSPAVHAAVSSGDAGSCNEHCYVVIPDVDPGGAVCRT